MKSESQYYFEKISTSIPIVEETAPPTSNFIGRIKELEILSELISFKKNINIIGPMGIGKTYLISKLVQNISSKTNRTMWYTSYGNNGFWRFINQYLVHYTENTLDNLLLGKFIRKMSWESELDLLKIQDLILNIMMRGNNQIIIIDNFNIDNKDLLFTFIKKAIHCSKINVRFLLISRKPIYFVQNSSRITIRGININDLYLYLQIIKKLELSAQEIGFLYTITEGNPLMIELIINGIMYHKGEESIEHALKYAHFIPEVQDYFYAKLSSLCLEEKALLYKFIRKNDCINGKVVRLCTKYVFRNHLDNLIQKGIVYKEEGFYSVTRMSKDYLTHIMGI